MRKIYTMLIVVFSLVLSHIGYAQEKNITGTVTSKIDGSTMPGVSVVVKGITRGVENDFDGNYTIKASTGNVLNFSFLGMKSNSAIVGASRKINVALEDDSSQLDEVIVSALGIKKSRKPLTYAAQDIKADELNKVKQTNPVNSLSSKVSGGPVKVVLRGNSSIGNNQPLYVVDGIPLSNPTSSQSGDTFGDINGGNRDGGDPVNASSSISTISTITIDWDAAATNEEQLERIITQKWIAMFPEGQEGSWLEYRRTGYPKIFPLMSNQSGGTIETDKQIRRITFVDIVNSINTAEVSVAVVYLNGSDNGGTRLWWDVAGPNF